MAKVRQRDLPTHPHARAIVKRLADLAYTIHPDQVFDDWLTALGLALRDLPRQLAHNRECGGPAPDTPEQAQEYARFDVRYGGRDKWLTVFGQTLGMLMEAADTSAAEGCFHDFLGEIYMAWGWPSAHLGQFFTPPAVTRLIAGMIDADTPAQIREALTTATRAVPNEVMRALAESALVIALALPPEQALEVFVQRVWPIIKPHYEPITIYDCCVGSGSTLLAYAERVPAWARMLGLVRFYGQDIDIACVRMARINCAIYGLWAHITHGDSLREPMLAPQPALVSLD